MSAFGDRVRTLRQAKQASDKAFSLRKTADRIGVSPTFLSRIESGKERLFPSEEVIAKLASELGENQDVLLALAGKVSKSLQRIIMRNPQLFGEILRQLENAPDHALLKIVRIVREVRDGDW